MTTDADPLDSDPLEEDRQERSDPLRRVARNSGWLLASRGAFGVLSIVYLAILTRVLGPEGFGVFALVASTVQAVNGIVTFQAWQIVVRYGSKAVADDDRPALARLALFTLMLEAGAAIAGLALACGVLAILGHMYGWGRMLTGEAMLYALAIFLSIRSTASGLLRVDDRFREGAIAETMVPLTRLVGALGALAFAPDLRVFLAVWALSEAAGAVAHWLFVRQTVAVPFGDGAGAVWRDVRSDHPDLLRFAWTSNLAVTFVSMNQHVVTLVVGFALGPVAAGLYRIGYQLGQALARVAEIPFRASFTEFNRLMANADVEGYRALASRLTRLSLVVAVVAVAAIALFGKPAILLIAGRDFDAAYPIVLLMGFAALVEFLTIAYQATLLSHGGEQKLLIVRMIASGGLVVALAGFIPLWGATGAAAGVAVSAIITYGLMRHHGVRAIRRFGAR